MSKQLNSYFEAFIVAFSFTFGLGVGVYIINLILPSQALSIVVILGTVFVGVFSMSLAYLKRFSNTSISEKMDNKIKKDSIFFILIMCIFSGFAYLFLYTITRKIIDFRITSILGILLIICSVFFIRYLISSSRKIKN